MTRIARPEPRWWLLLAALAALLAPGATSAAPRVVASIGPVHSLAAAVMGDRGEPRQIVRGYGSPHAYQMRPSDAASLRDAELVLWIGPTMETFLQRPLASARQGTRVVALADTPGVELIEGGHDHGDGHGVRASGFTDGHIWLSPSNAKVMARTIAEELRARAKDALLTMAIASEEELGSNEPAQDLLEMRGMDKQLAYVLASMSVITMEDLAEQSVDELMDIEGMTEEWAAELIMTAREPWFAEEGESA